MRKIGVEVNGHWFVGNNPNRIMADILIFLDKMRFDLWPYDALVEMFEGVVDLVKNEAEEVRKHVKGKEKAMLTRFLKKRFYIPATHDGMLKMIYNFVLDAEGLGNLHGFGVSNTFGDRVVGNPELRSLKTFPTLIKK